MSPSGSLRPGRRSRAQKSGRGRGAPSHNQTASRNSRNERDHRNPGTGYMMGGVFIPTLSTITTTVSTESHMEYGPSMGPYAPASESPELWPFHAGTHDLDDVGAQFADEHTQSLATSDGSGKYTGIQDESSTYPRIMVIPNKSRAGVFDPAGMSDLDNRGGS
ncbi:hypothetical protein COCMIDRAFT_30890 [Bipolaris oryzae ATCC 44560]|uniref:Uncharacterized protein n=1 Tax=Bipolaris oryzae ATCC 44560 TaxID=930090 RepID=W6YR59_COCMI|nr:uncharacterized protein COCMIDRAFT_30890 [Bipolaris oryzae ATCC 44560]EUC40120.1 hypothetical protein COCMIDRAFT_30890 [Bipolaris oryzae ATCC 44560]